MKYCLISSSGGHYEQITQLKQLIDEYDGFIVTEKTIINNQAKYYLTQINRKEILFIPKMLLIFFESLKILISEKPDIIISTGALSTFPMCLMAKLFRKKVIFIESFAKVDTPTLTGRIVYKFADLFIIQWENLREYYPNAIYGGVIY